jgi:SAM-dependent methyltransferase
MTPTLDAVVATAGAAGYRFSSEGSVWKGYQKFRGVGGENLGKHYGEWWHQAKRMGLTETEYLLPRVTVPFHDTLPAFMMGADDAARNKPDMLKGLRTARHKWGYYIYLGQGMSTLGEVNTLKGPPLLSKLRSLHRLRMIGEGVRKLCDLHDYTVLDMACNLGTFTLDFAAAGAISVTGVDLRADNIAKAKLLSDYLEVSASFDICNVYDLDEANPYDIVLNLGLLYHVTKPYQLIKKTYDMCNYAGVIESTMLKEPFSGFTLATTRETIEANLQHAAGEIPAELHPTYRAVIDMMDMVGFKTIVEIDAEPDPAWGGFDQDIFGRQLRRCLIGFK